MFVIVCLLFSDAKVIQNRGIFQGMFVILEKYANFAVEVE